MGRLEGISSTRSMQLQGCVAAMCLICLPPCLSAQAAGSAQTSAIPSLHATAQLVIIDVAVTDSSGAPVKSLPKTGFHVTESGKPQTISSFEEHDGIAAAKGSAPSAPAPAPRPGVFTNTVVSTGNSTVTVILLDLLNTPMENQAFVRNQL